MKLSADENDLLSPYEHAWKIRADNIMDKVTDKKQLILVELQ
jgi:hypothetical protein